jgi:nitrite reductase (NADH) large subunit
MKKLLVIGNGIAAGALLQELEQLGMEGFDITIFGDESTPAYNRVLLSNVLAGEESPENIELQSERWYQEHNIKRVLGTRIVAIDHDEQIITSECGTSYNYDLLVLATGASSRALDIPGKQLAGVMAFRSLDDAAILQQVANAATKTVVLGGGLLGLEAAAGLAKHGADVTVVHRNSYLMNRQLDRHAANLLQEELARKGVKFQLGRSPIELIGTSQVEGVRLDNDELVSAGCVIQAAGIEANISLAQASNIPSRKGILVNRHLQTAVKSVYALGECCEHKGETIGLVAPIRDQAKVLARVLLGDKTLAYRAKVTATQLKVSGIQLFSAGELIAQNEPAEEIYLRAPSPSDEYSTSYRKLLIRNNQVAGVVLFGDTSDSQWYFEKLQAGNDISQVREDLLFGQAFCA